MLRLFLLSALAAIPALAMDQAARDRIDELLRQRQWTEARSLLEQATAADPADARAWRSLGQANLGLQDSAAAVAACERAVQLQPDSSDCQLQLGHAYGLAAMNAGLFNKLGLAKKCKAAYDKAVELDPANVNARWSLMDFSRQAPGIAGGGMDLAYRHAEEIQRLDARRGRAAFASLYAAEKKFPEAFALYDEVLRKTPGEPDALFNVGRLAAQSGQQLDRGLACLRELAARPDRGTDARIPALLGSILEKMGDKAGARAAYEAAVALDPRNTRNLEALRRLKEG